MTTAEIREAAIDAILRELGPVGLIRFMQERTPGSGDYVKDREAWRPKFDTMDELLADIEKWEEKQGRAGT